MVYELCLGISPDGAKVAPDYGISSERKDCGDRVDILIPTHKNAEMDIIKRICQRYDVVIEGLKKIKNKGLKTFSWPCRKNECCNYCN